MFSKVVIGLMVIGSFAWSMSASMLQTVSKNELGCIKGLGVKRVKAIEEYRKNNQLNRLDELLNIKGIGKVILKNIEEDRKKKSCTNFDHVDKKKKESKKKDIKAE